MSPRSSCSRCVALQAAKDVVEGAKERRKKMESRGESLESRRRIKALLWVAFQWGMLALCLGIMAFRAPDLIRAPQEDKPLRYGTYQTDDKTDACIRALWQAAKLLQEGRMPGKDLVCPASQQPFIIERTDDDVVARSPRPQLYGFRDIRVSVKRPVPELIK